MARKVNVEVALSGEAKYKQAISELNAANKTMGAELKRLSAEYQGNSESMDYLTQKGEALQTMLDHQREKVTELKEAVKWAAQEYGEASTKTQSYAAQLATAETSVINLERAIEENNKAIKDQAHSIEEYDEKLKVLYSELAEIDSAMNAYGESTDLLCEKNDTLTEILEEQKKKYEELAEALKEAEESGTATQEQIDELKIKVNEAATAYNKTSAAIKENEEQLKAHRGAVDDEKKSLTGIGDVLSNVADKFGIDIPEGATKSLNGIKGFSAGTVAAMTAAAAGIALCVKAVTELHNLAVQYAAEADDIITKSAITGLSTTLLQELQYAEPLIDVSVDTITGSMTKLTKSMSDAAGGNESLAATFDRLGVSITNASDGSLRSVQEVFFELIDALGQVENETERNAIAMDLFGKSAQELNPLIQQGADVLQEYAEDAHEVYVLTENQVAALGSLDDQVQKNKLSWEGLKKQIAAEFAPASEQALRNFGELVKNAGKALIDSGIIKGVGEIFANLSNMLQPLSELLGAADSAPGRLRPVYEVLHGIAGVVAWIADAADAVIGMLTLDFSRIGIAMGYGKSSGQYSNLQQWQGYGNAEGWVYDPNTRQYVSNGFNASGNDNWRGGLTWVGENGPELVSLPKGSQISSAQDSREMMGVNNWYVTIDAKNVREFNDIVRMCRMAQAEERMG